MSPTLPSTFVYKERAFLLNPLRGARHFRLRYHKKKQQLCLTLPLWATARDIEQFLKQAQPWLDANAQQHTQRTILTHGARVSLWGQSCHITYQKDIRTKVLFEEGAVTVCSPRGDYASLLANGLKEKVLACLQGASATYAQQLGVSLGKITVRDLYARWGSCSARGDLSYAWRLLFAPLDVAHYVCAHEVSHRVYMDHSPRFWQTVESLCPHYKQSRTWLRAHGHELFYYAFE